MAINPITGLEEDEELLASEPIQTFTPPGGTPVPGTAPIPGTAPFDPNAPAPSQPGGDGSGSNPLLPGEIGDVGGLPPPQTVPEPSGGSNNLTLQQMLEQMVQSLFGGGTGTPNTFTFNGQTVDIPQFQPGTNPFGSGGVSGPITTPTTFGQITLPGQSAGVAGPGGSAGVNFSDPTQTLMSLIGGAAQGQLGQTRYDLPVVQQAQAQAFAELNRQADLARERVNADISSRGLYYSTPGIETLIQRIEEPLALAQGRATTDLLLDQSRTAQSDITQSIANALGFTGQQFGQGLAGAEFQAGEQARQFGEGLAMSQFSQSEQGRLFSEGLASAGLQQAEFSRLFGESLQGSAFAQSELDRVFQQTLAAAGFDQQLAQDSFNAAMQAAQLDLTQQNQQFGQEATGFQLNQGAEQQAFDQLQAAIAQLMGFSQQQFDQDLSTAQFNQGLDAQTLQYLLQLLGLA